MSADEIIDIVGGAGGEGIDTVEAAAATSDRAQPYAELGLKEDEYQRIKQILGRRPTETELAMYSIMWSEHCSYKSSKVHLKQFGEKAPKTDVLLVGMGENAGVVDVGEGLAVTFKVESHNHPSYVEPYQGAATGIGGIIRDILTMGARPIAVMDPLRFGDPSLDDTLRVVPGIVAGIGGYGNCMGLPNIGGEVVFDPCYNGNPLVNALCVGVMRHDRLQNSGANGPGNQVVLLGAKTGRDGIGGVSVLASATFDEGGPTKRPSVQVGDPFAEKILTECCLELFDAGLTVGIQDLGGAGLTCATTETSAHGTRGMRVDLDKVPLREASMTAPEIMASESQERMLAIVTPQNVEQVLAIAAKWGVLATVIGEVTDGDRLIITHRGQCVVEVPPGSLADDGPIYNRPIARPHDLDALQADSSSRLARPATGDELRSTLLTLLASPNLCSKRWVTEQYDRYVRGNTVLAQPEDSGMVRLTDSGLGIALSTDGNGRYAKLDPYAGAQLAYSEAYRNVAITGAKPVAVTNCLNFGSPEDPEVMWQFAQATTGLADACQQLGTPVTGGNVSFYNETGQVAIHPTPVIGMLGVIDDVTKRIRHGFTGPGDVVLLAGITEDELGGSAWADVVHSHLGGTPPKVRLAAEQALAQLLAYAADGELATSAHDLSEGGLAQALAESAIRGGLGATITLGGDDPFVALYSESSARAILTAKPQHVAALREKAGELGVPVAAIGIVNGEVLEVVGQFSIGLDELRDAFEGTLPALFG